ncbi:hydroxymethylbilane synthase, partial [Rhizobiaceae sp. 2RAB30]
GYATIADGRLSFNGLILRPDGREAHEIADEGPAAEAALIGRRAGEAVRAKAGTNFFDGWS